MLICPACNVAYSKAEEHNQRQCTVMTLHGRCERRLVHSQDKFLSKTFLKARENREYSGSPMIGSPKCGA